MKRTTNKGIILATDPASEFGWAISDTIYGIWDLTTRKDESMGMKLIRLEGKLKEIYEIHPFKVLVYERPGGRNKFPIMHQSKLIGEMEKWCEKRGIQYAGYSASEIKKFATGKGNANKEAMVKAAQERYGYEGDNDNVADALHLLHMVKHRLNI